MSWLKEMTRINTFVDLLYFKGIIIKNKHVILNESNPKENNENFTILVNY